MSLKLTLTNLPTVSSKPELNDCENGDLLSPRSTTSSKMAADPSNTKWQSDEDVNACSACQASFGLFNRKHHCRVCGLIFCHDCSNFFAAVPSMGFRHPVRVCGGCFMHRHSAKKSRSASKRTPSLMDDMGGQQQQQPPPSPSPAGKLGMIPTPRQPSSQAQAQAQLLGTPTTRKLFDDAMLSPGSAERERSTAVVMGRSPLRALNNASGLAGDKNAFSSSSSPTAMGVAKAAEPSAKSAVVKASPRHCMEDVIPAGLSLGMGVGGMGIPSPPPRLSSQQQPHRVGAARAPLPCGKGVTELVPSTLEVPFLSFSPPAPVAAAVPALVLVPAMEVPIWLRQGEQDRRLFLAHAQREEFCQLNEARLSELVVLCHRAVTKDNSPKKATQKPLAAKKKRSLLHPLRWVSLAVSTACLPVTLPLRTASAVLAGCEQLRATFLAEQIPYAMPTTPGALVYAAAHAVTHPRTTASKSVALLTRPLTSALLRHLNSGNSNSNLNSATTPTTPALTSKPHRAIQ